MAALARKWLTVPVTSASSERTFSGSGNLVSYKRYRLETDNVDKIIYCQQNYNKVTITKDYAINNFNYNSK